MVTFLETISALADAETIIAGSAVLGLSLIGATPRVGLVRGLALGWRSAVKTTYPQSVRTADFLALTESLQYLEKGQYIAVIGGKGNGKSCLIDSCLNRTYGVIKTSVSLNPSSLLISPLFIMNNLHSV